MDIRNALACALALGIAVCCPPTEAKHLRWASQGEINTLDPHANNESFNNNQNNQVYEYLAQRDKVYAKLVPALAVSWENIEPTKWIVKLRRDVRFHDGTRFTADDVVFSFDRARIANSTFKLYSSQAGIPRKIDDHTVEFTTPVPNPLFDESIGTIFVMSKAWAEKNNAVTPQDFRGKEDSYSARNAMGTGPFRLVSHEPRVKTLYAKNTEWWGIKEGGYTGNVETVEYRPITNSAMRMAALRSGEIDFVLDPPVQEVEQLRKDRALKVWEGSEIRVIFVALDQGRDELVNSDVKGKNPFKDKRVRQALFLGIDIDAIRKQVMRGLSSPTGIMLPDPRGASSSDATMSPYEILQPGGSVEYFNEEPGAVWVKRVTDVYPKCIWLNPEPEEIWAYLQSISIVKELMNGRMFPTTLEGLERAMKVLAK